VGGKFKSEYDKENNIISGPCLLRIFRIFQKFNFYPAVGVTAGKTFSFNICYQYGIKQYAGKSEL
jgi:hypothetical protein